MEAMKIRNLYRYRILSFPQRQKKPGMRLQKCAVPCENSEERMDSDVRCRNFLHSLKKLKIV